jgi:hypothetical protein
MKKFLMSVAALALMAGVANAASGNVHYANVGNWDVYANGANGGYCATYVNYPRGGYTLLISENSNGWHLVIGGVHGREGATYNVPMRTTNGNSGTLVGQYSGGAIGFWGLSMSTLEALARSKGIAIKDVGKFRLDSSYAAILRTHECFGNVKAYMNAKADW